MFHLGLTVAVFHPKAKLITAAGGLLNLVRTPLVFFVFFPEKKTNRESENAKRCWRGRFVCFFWLIQRCLECFIIIIIIIFNPKVLRLRVIGDFWGLFRWVKTTVVDGSTYLSMFDISHVFLAL